MHSNRLLVTFLHLINLTQIRINPKQGKVVNDPVTYLLGRRKRGKEVITKKLSSSCKSAILFGIHWFPTFIPCLINIQFVATEMFQFKFHAL